MRNLDRYRGFIHPLLAFLLPAAFLVPAASVTIALIGAAFPLPPLYAVGGPLPFLAACMTAGLLAVAMGNVAHDERLGISARIRELVYGLMVCWAAGSVFASGPFLSRFRIGLENIGLSVAFALQWFLSIHFHEALRAREDFIDSIEGLAGTDLQNAVRDSGGLSIEALTSLGRLRTASTLFAFALAILWGIASAAGAAGAGLAAVIASVPCFMAAPLIHLLLAQYDLEHRAAGEGLIIGRTIRSRRIRFGLILTGSAIGAALVLAVQGPMLPIRWLAEALEFLSRLFASRGDAPPPRPPKTEPPAPDFRDMLRGLEEDSRPPLFDLTPFIPFLKRAALFTGIALVVIFLFSPFFSAEFRRALRTRSLAAYLRKKLRDFISLFRSPPAEEREPVVLSAAELRSLKERLDSIAGKRRSREKRREIGRLAKRFLRVIEWGGARSVRWTAATGPAEFCGILSGTVPELRKELTDIADIFEEALYSDRALDPEKHLTYERAVRKTLAVKKEVKVQ